MANSELQFRGDLSYQVIRGTRDAPLAWRVQNMTRWGYISGRIYNWLARAFSRLTGVVTLTSELSVRKIEASGLVVDFGKIGFKSVTDAGVEFMVDDWDDDSQDITTFNYHASGTNSTAEAVTQTGLLAEATTITDRATGTKSQPTAAQIRSVGTQSFTGAGAIVEHGLFSSVTESSGTLWDRTVFSAINVTSGDSIEWTYTLTINSGG